QCSTSLPRLMGLVRTASCPVRNCSSGSKRSDGQTVKEVSIMLKAHSQEQAISHPHVPGWGLSLLSVSKLASGKLVRSHIGISREDATRVGQGVYTAVERAPSQMLIGIDLRGISLMPSFLWRQIGPLLQAQVIEGALGSSKRVLYVTGGDED